MRKINSSFSCMFEMRWVIQSCGTSIAPQDIYNTHHHIHKCYSNIHCKQLFVQWQIILGIFFYSLFIGICSINLQWCHFLNFGTPSAINLFWPPSLVYISIIKYTSYYKLQKKINTKITSQTRTIWRGYEICHTNFTST